MADGVTQSMGSSAEGTRVRRMEVHPRLLEALGCLGHAWMPALLLLTLVPAVALFDRGVGSPFVPVTVIALLVALFAMAAIRVRIEPAAGIRLPPNLAPALHDLIDALRAPLRTPRYADVLMDTSMGIRTLRVPRLGGLRGFDDYLVIGLPLLLALPVDHVRSLIAHELAHRSRREAVRGARVYRMRLGWLNASDAVSASRRPLARLMRPFHCWFAGTYASLSFRAAFDHELAADRRAAQLTSRDHFAGALLRLRVIERFLVERFHPRLLADLRNYGVPPTGLSGRLEKAVDGIRHDPRFNAWVDAALRREVEGDDTHASLRRRLSALAIGDVRGGRPSVIESAFSDEHAGMSAARLCLAAIPDALMVSIEKAWTDAVQAELAERHEELLRMDERRRELEKRADLSPAELLEKAIATAETDGDASALPLLLRLAERNPDFAPGRFVLGTLLLRANDEHGLLHLHAAIRMDPALDAHGRELAAEFLRANGERSVEAVLPAGAG